MYTIGILLYEIGIYIASFFNKKAKLFMDGQRKAFKTLREKVVPDAEYIWFHAASLGEFEQGRVLIERVRKQYPQYKILLTFFSPSGYEVRKDYDGADIVCYLPMDTFYNSARFLKLVHPKIVFFIKYEYWGNYLYSMKHRHIPVYSVSSIFRRNQTFFKPYGWQYANMLKCFTHLFVQNEESQDLLAQKGITQVSVVGDTRFDRVLEVSQSAQEVPLAALFANNKKENEYVLVAGSTWPPDEDIILAYFNTHPQQRLIIAPHVISEDHLKEIERKLQRNHVRLSQATETSVLDAECLIIDSYGKLSSIYRYGQIGYIGGGFGVGIHNVPEAAVYGIPTIVGPNNKKFLEVPSLIADGATFEIQSAQDYETLMHRLEGDKHFRDEAGRKAHDFIRNGAGAVDKIMNFVKF